MALAAVHVAALFVAAAAGRWLRLGSRAERRTAVTTVVEAALGTVTVTCAGHLHLVDARTYRTHGQETYSTYAHKRHRKNENPFLHCLGPKLNCWVQL